MNQSEWYESWGDIYSLSGNHNDAEKCYRASQNHILVDDAYMITFKRIQQKIISSIDNQCKTEVCV